MDLLIERNGQFEQRALPDGEHRLGSSEGVPPALALSLYVEGGRLSVEAGAPVRVGGVLLPPGLRRLVMPGEPIEPVSGCVLRVRPEVPRPAPQTRAVVRSLLEPGAAPAAASLVSLTGLEAGRLIPLADRPAVIGRGENADHRLRDRAISRLHARISPHAEGHTIEDLGTANGVYVNGSRLHGPHLLEDGALVELGQTLLRYTAPKPAKSEAQSGSAVGLGDASDRAATAPPHPSDPASAGVAACASPAAANSAQASPAADSDGRGPQSEAAWDDGPHAGSDEGRSREQWLFASGALIFLLGVALTFGCLAYARSAQARSGESPARSTTSSASLR